MPTFYQVLRASNDGALVAFKTDQPTKEDHGRIFIRLAGESDMPSILEGNHSNWSYNCSTSALLDKNGNSLRTTSPIAILRIVNLFGSIDEALDALFDPDEKTVERITHLVASLTENRKKELDVDIKAITSEIHGKKSKIGKQAKAIDRYKTALQSILGIVQKKHRVDSTLSKEIVSLIESSGISNYQVCRSIVELLESHYYLPKRKTIENLINQALE